MDQVDKLDAARAVGLALEAGFELAGIAPARPVPEASHFIEWAESGLAGEMGYLTDHRAGIRLDPRRLLPAARSVLCVAKLYHGPEPLSVECGDHTRGWISRYAWGEDYHDVLRGALKRLAGRLEAANGRPFARRIAVDTAPFLDVAYARHAGLGWIGKNTCLINEQRGSWFFLGAVLMGLELAPGAPPPDRCGACTACIDACPTRAIVASPRAPSGHTVDARRCISYLTIELRGAIPEKLRPAMGRHVFGCDICQDVCPWNRRAPQTREDAFAPRLFNPPLDRLATLTEAEFRTLFRATPVSRAKYRGFLRNVCVAMGNSRDSGYRGQLEKLAASADPMIREHAGWALARLG